MADNYKYTKKYDEQNTTRVIDNSKRVRNKLTSTTV